MEKKFTVDFEVSEELHKQVELMISGGFGVSVYVSQLLYAIASAYLEGQRVGIDRTAKAMKGVK